MTPKLIIPEEFILVCKKMYPEIDDISYVSFEKRKMHHPTSFELMERFNFFVSVNIHFVPGSRPKGDKHYYYQELNKMFQYTYGKETISFRIEEMIVPLDKTDDEMFFEIFKPVLV